MNIYIAFYRDLQIEIEAESTIIAQQMVAKALKVPAKKWYLITIMLAQKDGKQVTHTPDF